MEHANHPVVFQALPKWDSDYASTSLTIAKLLSKNRPVYYVEHPFSVVDAIKKTNRKSLNKRTDTTSQPFADFPNFTVIHPPLILPFNSISDSSMYYSMMKMYLKKLWKQIDSVLKDKQFYTSEKKNYEYWTKRIMDSQSKKQEQIASVMRMRALMDFKSKEKYAKLLLNDMEDKCLVFCNTQEQADRICKQSYHSNNPDSEDNLQEFKDGNISELSCVMQLNEGVNIPNLRAGIIMHAYGNERKANQRIGRLLRLNPDDTAYIHILCYSGTVDERWVAEALRDLDPRKIKYFDVNLEDYE